MRKVSEPDAEAEFPGTETLLAFEVFSLKTPPVPSKCRLSIEKLCDTFKLEVPVADVVEQFHDFQKFAIFQDKQHGALDSFDCWKQSILKVSSIRQLVARLGAFRGQAEFQMMGRASCCNAFETNTISCQVVFPLPTWSEALAE